MKKIISLLTSIVLIFSLSATSVFASQPDTKSYPKSNYKLIGTYKIPVARAQSLKASTGENAVTIDVYKNGGKKVFKAHFGDSAEETQIAFDVLNKFMRSGSVEEQSTRVIERNKEYYLNEDSAKGPTKGHSWANYTGGAGVLVGGLDTTTGGSSAMWTSESGKDIKLVQTTRVNVSGAQSTLSVSFPAGVGYSETQTQTTATSTWTGERDTANPIGASYEDLEIHTDDVCGGKIISLVHTDSAEVRISNTTYKPTQQLRFNVSTW